MASYVLPAGFSLIECGPSDAGDAFRLTRAILAELEAEGKLGQYNLSVSKETFYDYYEAGDCVLLAIENEKGERVACAVGHFRQYKTAKFVEPLRRMTGRFFKPEELGYAFFIEVAKEYRGRGFQYCLFLELEKRLTARGAKWLTGTVSPENAPSLRNFLRAGYVEIGRTTLESGYPRLLMAKKVG